MNGAVGFGVFSVGSDGPRVGFRVGHGVLDLATQGLGRVFELPSLNPFLALGRSSWEDTMARIRELVDSGVDLVPLEDAEVHMPFAVADYVDFYSSLEHATNLGRLFRPDSDPLLAELAPPPGRVPRARRNRGRQRDTDRAAVRPVEGALRRGAALRSEPETRHRARARLRRRSRKHAGRARAGLGLPRPRLRRRARQRLECARHPGVGVPAARPLPRQVVRDLDRRLGHAARTPRGQVRTRSGAGSGSRSRTSAPRATGRSTSSSRSRSAARSSRVRTRVGSTGRCRSSSRMPP